MDKKKNTQEIIKQIKLRDRVVRVLSKDGMFRVAAIKNTKTVQTAQEKHQLPYLPAFLLARSLSAASLMSSFMKGEERITLEIEGDGPVNYIYAEALQVGELRGYVNYSKDINSIEIESISDLLGVGVLRVVKILYDNKEPLVSIIELQKGDIATDLAYYFAQSEQIPSAVILDVDFDNNGKITQSGGVLVQSMPGASQSNIENLYSSISNIKSLADYFEQELTPDKLLKEILPFEFDVIGSTQVDFFCRCSKDVFMKKLLTLDTKEIEEMKEAGDTELVCHYCNEKYYLNEDDFNNLIQRTIAKNN